MTNVDNMFLAGDACSKLAFCKAYLEDAKSVLLEIDTGLMTEIQKKRFADLLKGMEWMATDTDDCCHLCNVWLDSMMERIGGVGND